MQPSEDNSDGVLERGEARQPGPVRRTAPCACLEYLGLTTGAFATYGTSPQPNTHITDVREIRYPWHPWYGEQVQIRESLIKGGQGILRCVPDGNRPSRSLEVPLWMFDRAVCCTMRLSDVPVVSCEVLLRLKAFLRRDAAGDAETVIQAQHLSPRLKGDADAKAFRSLPGSPAEVVSPPCEESRVAGPADRSQAGEHGAAGTHAARAPRKLHRLRGRRGGER